MTSIVVSFHWLEWKRITLPLFGFFGKSSLFYFCQSSRLYRSVLDELGIEHKLYIAVSEDVYVNDFNREMVKLVIERNQIPLLIVALDTEEVIEWTR